MPMFAYRRDDDWIVVPSRSDALSILSLIEAIEVLARSLSALEHPASRLLHVLKTESVTGFGLPTG